MCLIWRRGKEKFYGDRPGGTPPLGELNTRGVAEHSESGSATGGVYHYTQREDFSRRPNVFSESLFSRRADDRLFDTVGL